MLRILPCLLLAAASLPLLAQEGDAEHIARIVRQLGSEDRDLREAASREILEIGRPAVNALREAAKGSDPVLSQRANELYPYVRWGVGNNCPKTILDLLARFEGAAADRRAQALRELAGMPDVDAADALRVAWWDVEDPALLAELARTVAKRPREPFRKDPTLDPDAVELRLKALEPGDDPQVLSARAEARRRRGDAAGACELYARIDQGLDDPALCARWGDALFRAHRCSDAAEVLSHALDEDGSATFRRIECLYRAGRRDDAESALTQALRDFPEEQRRSLAELALSHGSARLIVERPAGAAEADPSMAAQAWIRLGKLDRAEEAWRHIVDDSEEGRPRAHGQEERRRTLGLLLDARGEAYLLTPAFLEEALSPTPADAERHRRLAASIEATDPGTALREWKKARLLDPSSEECGRAIERLGPRVVDARGCWITEVPAPPVELLFATSPVRLGDFYYYMNMEGDVLKVRDPLDPAPEWVYSPPHTPLRSFRGFSLEGWLEEPHFALGGGKLLALFHEIYCATGPDGGDRLPERYRLCVVDAASGHEEYTRAFPSEEGEAALWPESGVVTLVGTGLSVFDIASRAWRWTVSDLGQGHEAVWVQGDAVYVGSSSGDLRRLRLSDGSLVWRKKFPGTPRWGVELRGAGGRLLFHPQGQHLVALSLADDQVLWEMQPREIANDTLLSDEEHAYVLTMANAYVEAVSLTDGKVAWECVPCRGFDPRGCVLSDHALWFGELGKQVCLDKASGRVLWVDASGGRPYSGAWFVPAGDTLYASGADRPRPWSERDRWFREAASLTAVRLSPGPDAPAPALPKDEDATAEVSLLEDACYGPSVRDGEAWLALARAMISTGHWEVATDAVRMGILLSATADREAEEWAGRIGDEAGKEKGDWERLRTLEFELKRMGESLKLEEAVRSAQPLPAENGSMPGFHGFVRVLLDPSPEVTFRRAISMSKTGYGYAAAPFLARALGDVPEPLAMEAVGLLLFAGIESEDCSRLWGGSPFDRPAPSTGDLEAALRARLEGPEGAVRGAALAMLELMGSAVPEQKTDASLRAAFASEDRRARLAAAAALARRGDAKRAILEAIRSDDRWLRRVAVWIAGNLRMQEAVDALPSQGAQPGGPDLEALAEIGTSEAWDKVFRTLEVWRGFDRSLEVFLSRSRAPRGVDALARLARDSDRLSEQERAFAGLVWMDTRASRLAAMDFARRVLHLLPDHVACLGAMVRGRLEQADAQGATAFLERLEGVHAPSPWLFGLRSRVLASKGDLDGARESRRRAEACLDRAEAVSPGSYMRLVERAKLYLEPEAIADRATARALLEKAMALAPRDPEVLRLLETADGK